MTGTILNIIAIMIGGSLGILVGSRMPDRVRGTVLAGLGLFTIGLGVSLFLQSQQPLLALGSLLVGGLIGEWWRIEDRLEELGNRLQRRFEGEGTESGSTFVRGFVTASVLFCVGPLTILGSIQDGLTGDFSLLAIKSMLDGFASLALASTLGIGVLFSILVVLVYQGGLTLLAAQAQSVLTEAMITEMTAVGGILILGLGISSLLELRKIRTSNLLPALFVAPFAVWLLSQPWLVDRINQLLPFLAGG